MDTLKMKEIRRTFLAHIGQVIMKHRKKLGYTQEYLGNEIGVSRGSINRYETSGSDISASTMAYLSVVLGFPMKEYVETDNMDLLYHSFVPIDEQYQSLIRFARTGEASPEILPVTEESSDIPQSERDDFIKYFSNTETVHKSKLLTYVFDLSTSLDDIIGNESFRALAQATIDYLISDEDASVQNRLKAYRRKCERLIDNKTDK